jgi:HPt (histidine-containing phosphotransfer) domain-containing protein
VTDTDIIDRAALEKLFEDTGGDRAFLRELINSYLDDAVGLVAVMRHAVDESSAVELRRAAHTLKSNSASFGARALVGMCQDLEQRARDGILDGAAARVARIEAAYPGVERELRTLARPPDF